MSPLANPSTMFAATEYRRFPDLATEFEPLERRKAFERQLMKFDEEIVGALPRDERFMS